MEPIGNVSPTLELLRRQMADNLARLRQAGRLPGTAGPLEAAGAPPPGLRQTVGRRLGTLSLDDADFAAKAADLLIESVLVDEFGEHLVNSPDFQDLVREVRTALLSDEEMTAQLNALASASIKRG